MSFLSPSSTRTDRTDGPMSREAAPRTVSFRAVALGLVLVPLLCAWSLKHELIHGGSEFVEASLVIIAVFALFVLVLINERLRRRAPKHAFSQGELLTVYTMLTVSLGIAGLGGMQVLPQALGAAFYRKTLRHSIAKKASPFSGEDVVPAKRVAGPTKEGIHSATCQPLFDAL